MPTRRVWEAFPPTYRTKEVEMLAHWILAGESCSVVGLPGCGRSNLLDFLCHRPEVLHTYLLPDTGPIVLIPVNLHSLPASDLATLYRVILRSFYWIRDRFDQDMQGTITALYLENRAAQDPFLSQSALHELLFAFQAEPIRVVLVLNHFDRFCQAATPQMLNTLRGLRDSFKETLCFIVGMCQEVAYLSDPDALGDLYELLDTHVCWVGAMEKNDARWVIAWHTAPTLPTEAEMQAMLTLTGGFPVLLRAISYWWLDAGSKLPTDKWLAVLAEDRAFDFRLARFWRGLTHEEQFACAAVRKWQEGVAQAREKSQDLKEAAHTLIEKHGHILPRLATKGLCLLTQAGWQIRGELMVDYVRRVGPSSRGKIWIDEKTGDIYQGLTRLQDLPPQEGKLLRFLIQHPYKRHKTKNLISEIFDDLQRGPENIFPIVHGLRDKIEVQRSDPHYVIAHRGSYQFFPEGRPAYAPEQVPG